MSSRDVIFARIRNALSDVTTPDPVADIPLSWEYGKPLALDDVLGTFIETCVDYKAVVERVPAKDVPKTITKMHPEAE